MFGITSSTAEPRDDDGSGRSGRNMTVGTAAELIARGPPQPCAGCTRTNFDQGSKVPRMDGGLFFQRGWVVLCSAHQALDALPPAAPAPAMVPASSARPISFSLPALSSSQQQPVISISVRWRQQIKKQRKKARRSVTAPGHVSTTAYDRSSAP